MKDQTTLTEIVRKHKDAILTCPEYPGNPTRTTSMCAARHSKAKADPEGLTYSSCINCSIGIKASQEGQPAKKHNKAKVYKEKAHLCSKCGMPTRDKFCATCKLSIEAEEKKEESMAQQERGCKEDGCTSLGVFAKGYCRKCYDRLRRERIAKRKKGTSEAPAEERIKREGKKAFKGEDIPYECSVPPIDEDKEEPTTISAQTTVTSSPEIQIYPPLALPPYLSGIQSSKESEDKKPPSVACLAQLLLCSQMIEIEIKELLETETFSKKNIIDVRFRLGEILMETFK